MKQLCFAAILLLSLPFAGKAQLLKTLKKAEREIRSATNDNKSRTSSPETSRRQSPEQQPEVKTTKTDRTRSVPAMNKSEKTVSDFGTLITELEKGELLVYGEQSLALSRQQQQVKFITRKQGQFYMYQGSVKTGPFAKPPVQELDHWTAQKKDLAQLSRKTSEYQKYISNGNFIVDGKSYGKQVRVHAFYHHAEKKKFFAIISQLQKDDYQYYFITERSKIKIKGIAHTLVVSEDNQYAAIKTDAADLPLEAAATEGTAYRLLFDDGSKSVMMSGIAADFEYLDHKKNFIQVAAYEPAQIKVNGQKVLSLSGRVDNRGALLMGKNPGSCAWAERGSLYFSDGTEVSHLAISPVVVAEENVDYILWISWYENKIYACKKAL